MNNKQEKNEYGITVFAPGTPPGIKARGICFFIFFTVIILIVSCYWLFANSLKPIIFGMPFGMFFIVLFIVLGFCALLILYYLESRNSDAEGGMG